jgi:hypothetical protein
MRNNCFTRIAGFALGTVAVFTPAISAQTVTIRNERLVSTTLVVNRQDSTASCEGTDCSVNPVLMFKPVHVSCPAGIGKTCTLNITLDAKAEISPLAYSAYQFLLDGAAPKPGPTDGRGLYVFSVFAPGSGFGASQVRQNYPASVVGKVTNSKSEDHKIRVSVMCGDAAGQGGCAITTHWSTMRIDVFEP